MEQQLFDLDKGKSGIGVPGELIQGADDKIFIVETDDGLWDLCINYLFFSSETLQLKLTTESA